MVHYRCRDCGDVDMVYVDGVRITWNAQEQRWDIDPDGKTLTTLIGLSVNLRCSDCQSWNVEEYEEAE